MNHEEFKKKLFSERPDIKQEYDRMKPQYKIIKALTYGRTKRLTMKQPANIQKS